MKDIGKKIRKIRKLKGFTQQDMADKLLMSQNNYSKIELGHVSVSPDRLQKIADALNLSSEQILKFDKNQVFDTPLPTYLPTYLKTISPKSSKTFHRS